MVSVTGGGTKRYSTTMKIETMKKAPMALKTQPIRRRRMERRGRIGATGSGSGARADERLGLGRKRGRAGEQRGGVDPGISF